MLPLLLTLALAIALEYCSDLRIVVEFNDEVDVVVVFVRPKVEPFVVTYGRE